MSAATDEILEKLKTLSLLEASELVSQIEEAFGVKADPYDLVEYPVDMDAIEAATTIENLHEAVAKTVELYLTAIERHDKNEERICLACSLCM